MGDEETKRLILARRARFLAAAVASVAATAGACGGGVEDNGESVQDGGAREDRGVPQPCLSKLPDDAGDPSDADAEPRPCLSPPPPDASADASDDADAEPQPCLSPLPPDGG